MTTIETQGITMPAAPLVWEAVDFARQRAESRARTLLTRKGREDEGREIAKTEAMVCCVADWVVEHARQDTLFLLEFGRQLADLYAAIADAVRNSDAIMDSPKCYSPNETEIKYYCLHLVLMGEDTVRKALEHPEVLANIYNAAPLHLYHADILCLAANRLFSKPAHYRWGDIGDVIADLMWKIPHQIALFLADGVVPVTWPTWASLQADTAYGPAIAMLCQSHLDSPCGVHP